MQQHPGFFTQSYTPLPALPPHQGGSQASGSQYPLPILQVPPAHQLVAAHVLSGLSVGNRVEAFGNGLREVEEDDEDGEEGGDDVDDDDDDEEYIDGRGASHYQYSHQPSNNNGSSLSRRRGKKRTPDEDYHVGSSSSIDPAFRSIVEEEQAFFASQPTGSSHNSLPPPSHLHHQPFRTQQSPTRNANQPTQMNGSSSSNSIGMVGPSSTSGILTFENENEQQQEEGVVEGDDEHEPLYVNAKQYHRIMKRRIARGRLEEMGRLSRERKVCIKLYEAHC